MEMGPQIIVEIKPHLRNSQEHGEGTSQESRDRKPNGTCRNMEKGPQRNVEMKIWIMETGVIWNVKTEHHGKMETGHLRNMETGPQRKVQSGACRIVKTGPHRNVKTGNLLEHAHGTSQVVEMEVLWNVETAPHRKVQNGPTRNVQRGPHRNEEM